VQSQQLPTESQVLEDKVLTGTENADQPTEEMSERHDHGKNFSGKIRIQLCAKSFILQVYDVLARHRATPTRRIPPEVPVKTKRSRWLPGVLGLVLVGGISTVLARHWPYSEAQVVPGLQDTFKTSVRYGRPATIGFDGKS
jgi:hypothetical protein